ncbi:sulfotransferase domain-containing protein [Trichothermofontia sp.]
MKPDFIIIGVQKGGTTSLYHDLIQHPQIAPALDKEVHFFDLEFQRGWDWYESRFPGVKTPVSMADRDRASQIDAPQIDTTRIITGEASPYYIFHPLVPQRIAQTLPEVKLIVLLRDPVDRAISHYHHAVRWGFEKLAISEAFAQEASRLAGETEKILADPTYHSFNHRHLSYLARGLYANQLEHWFQYFPREQFLILSSETFYRDPENSLATVYQFLDLPHYPLTEYERIDVGKYPPSDPQLRQQLADYFFPHNQRLMQLLDRHFDWQGLS